MIAVNKLYQVVIKETSVEVPVERVVRDEVAVEVHRVVVSEVPRPVVVERVVEVNVPVYVDRVVTKSLPSCAAPRPGAAAANTWAERRAGRLFAKLRRWL